MSIRINFDEYYAPGAPGSQPNPFSPAAQAARDEALRAKFASGDGVLQLQPGMPDIGLLLVLKFAIEHSAGKPFTVVTAGTTPAAH